MSFLLDLVLLHSTYALLWGRWHLTAHTSIFLFFLLYKPLLVRAHNKISCLSLPYCCLLLELWPTLQPKELQHVILASLSSGVRKNSTALS